MVCFSEKWSIPRAKARAVPRHRMPCDALVHSGPQTGKSRSRLKKPCEKLLPLKSAACLRRAQASSFHHTHTVRLDNKHDGALLALAILARYHR